MTSAELEAALLGPDVETRRLALVEAGRVRDRALAWQMLGALGDHDWRVREEAVRVVSEVAVDFDLLHGLVDCLAQGVNVGLRNAAREVFRNLGPLASPTLIAALSEVDDAARKFVVEALACTGQAEALAALLHAMESAEAMESIAAIDALAQLGGDGAIDALRRQLAAADSFLRTAALDALVRLQAKLSWDELAPLLEDRLLRRVALGALGYCQDLRALPHLMAALSEKSPHVVARVLLGLSFLQRVDPTYRAAVRSALATAPADALSRVRTFVSHEDPNVALAACLVLVSVGRPEAAALSLAVLARGVAPSEISAAFADLGDSGVDMLLQASSKGAPEQALVIELLADMATQMAFSDTALGRIRELLREAIQSRDDELVQTALRSCGRFCEAQDAALLVEHATCDDVDRAHLACLALHELSLREIGAVRSVLAPLSLTGAAASALAELMVDVSVPDTLGRLRSALLSGDPSERMAALSGLGRLGGEASAVLAALALRDESLEVQVSALHALSCMPNAGVIALDALLAFEGTEEDAQTALSRALCRVADARALPRLRELSRAGAPGARLFALRGLIALGDPLLEDVLGDALGDPDSEVVKETLTGLGENRGARSVPRISVALEHSAWDVRRHAADWLRRLHAVEALPALQDRLGRETDPYVRKALSEAVAELSEVR